MTRLADTIDLGPQDEAERLWSAAVKAQRAATDDLVQLLESLDLGLHAAEILAIHLLQPAKDKFPATIAVQLNMPDPEVDPHRDGIHVPKVLQFTDVGELEDLRDVDAVPVRVHLRVRHVELHGDRRRELVLGGLQQVNREYLRGVEPEVEGLEELHQVVRRGPLRLHRGAPQTFGLVLGPEINRVGQPCHIAIPFPPSLRRPARCRTSLAR